MQPDKIGPWKGPDTRSKCVVTMNPTQADQSGVVGIKSASPGPSEDLQGPKRGLLGPKRTLFARFLELGGSIWAKTVLNEPSIPLRRSGHPRSLYLKQKEFPKKLGHGNLGIGPEKPLFGPWGPSRGLISGQSVW